MKFAIETHLLAKALKIAAVAIVGGPSLPILGNVKIEAADGQAQFSTTNLELYVRQKVACDVKKDGAITLPHSLLSALTGRITATAASIEANGKEAVFKAGEVTAVIETLPADEFPPPPKLNNEKAKEIDAPDILKPFAMLSHAIGDDPSRYQLMGINLSPAKNGTDFAATNGTRLAIYHGQELSSEDVIAPDIFARALPKMPFGGKLKAIIADGFISVSSEETELTAKLIEAKYPNYKVAVPKRSEQAFSCDRQELLRALQTCLIFTDRSFPGVQLAGTEKQIEVSQPGKATVMVMGADLAGQPTISVRLNARHLIEALTVLENDEVRIQYTDANSPVMIEEGAFRAIINRMLAAQ